MDKIRYYFAVTCFIVLYGSFHMTEAKAAPLGSMGETICTSDMTPVDITLADEEGKQNGATSVKLRIPKSYLTNNRFWNSGAFEFVTLSINTDTLEPACKDREGELPPQISAITTEVILRHKGYSSYEKIEQSINNRIKTKNLKYYGRKVANYKIYAEEFEPKQLEYKYFSTIMDLYPDNQNYYIECLVDSKEFMALKPSTLCKAQLSHPIIGLSYHFNTAWLSAFDVLDNKIRQVVNEHIDKK